MAPSSTRYQLRLLLSNLFIFSVVLTVAHAKGHHPGRQAAKLRQMHMHMRPTAANDRNEFLNEHNAVRAKYGERPLAWNRTLARYARRYANQRAGDCEMTHSNGPYGENIFWGGKYEDFSAAYAVKSWANETIDYDSIKNACKANQMCGHYTQIVWVTTTRLGCARVKCNSGGVFAICVYDPPGNFQGENPFKAIGDYLKPVTDTIFGGNKMSLTSNTESGSGFIHEESSGDNKLLSLGDISITVNKESGVNKLLSILVNKDSGTTKISQQPAFTVTVDNKTPANPPPPMPSSSPLPEIEQSTTTSSSTLDVGPPASSTLSVGTPSSTTNSSSTSDVGPPASSTLNTGTPAAQQA